VLSEGRQRIVLKSAEMVNKRIDKDSAADAFVINNSAKPDDLASMRLVPFVGEISIFMLFSIDEATRKLAKRALNLLSALLTTSPGRASRVVFLGRYLHESLQEAQVHGNGPAGDVLGSLGQLLPAIITISLAHGAKRIARGKVIAKRRAAA
jgi:hypothetical protein